MGFNFNGDDVDTMDGFDSEEAGDPFTQPGVEPPVPGAPAESAQIYVPDPVSILDAQENQEEDYEKVLSQVDRRMRVAHFYRSILDSALFEEDTSEAKIVQNRIRKFCNEELEVLFGMRTTTTAFSQTPAQFSPEEAAILKNLAAQVKLTKDAKTAKPAIVKPTVNKVQTKPASAVQIVQTQARQPKQQVQQTPPPAQPKTGKMDMRIPERYRNDPTAKISNGKVYIQARNEENQPLWRQETKNGKKITSPVMRDVTPVAVPTGSMIQPIAMPSIVGGPNSPFSQVMQQHADMTLQSLDRAASMPGVGGNVARQLGGSLAISLMNKQGDDE